MPETGWLLGRSKIINLCALFPVTLKKKFPKAVVLLVKLFFFHHQLKDFKLIMSILTGKAKHSSKFKNIIPFSRLFLKN